jgi:hypothetical protein
MPRTFPALHLVLLALAASAGPLGAQTSAQAAWQSTPASVLKSALRTVATAQERYFVEHARYAESASQLALSPEQGVRITVLGAGPEGWRAKATYDGQSGRSCVVFVGSLGDADAPRTDGDREMAGEEGVPLCDRMR